MQIQDALLSKSEYTRPGTKRPATTGLVFHYVGIPRVEAANVRSYFESLKAGIQVDSPYGRYTVYASSNYVIGRCGEILRLIPEDEVSYTSGGVSYVPGILENLRGQNALPAGYQLQSAPHLYTVGVEVCYEDVEGRYSPQTWEAQVAFAADFLRRYKLGVDRLFRHFDITGKQCPMWFVRRPDEWERFKREVGARMAA